MPWAYCGAGGPSTATLFVVPGTPRSGCAPPRTADAAGVLVSRRGGRTPRDSRGEQVGMSVDRRGSSKQGPDTTAQRAPTVPAVGKSTLIESRYPALDQALRHGGAARDGEPTIHDAATPW